MPNKVVFGLKNVYVAFKDALGDWETPVAIPGAVNLSLSGEGDTSTFYADDVAYYQEEKNNGYTGNLEAALIPDAVLSRMLGWDVDDNGALVELSDGTAEPFALLCEVDGDLALKRYVFYNVLAGRPNVEHNTKTASVEAKTSSLPVTITPTEIDSQMLVKSALERTVANAATFDSFFTTVYEPTFSVS